MRFILTSFSRRLVSDHANTISCVSAPVGGFRQSRVIPHYGKRFEVLLKSPITLLSSPRFSAADQLPPHALPTLPNTWPGCGYLRGWNLDVVVSGGVAIASV